MIGVEEEDIMTTKQRRKLLQLRIDLPVLRVLTALLS